MSDVDCVKESYSTYYDLEISKLIEQINSDGCERVLLQFPDGLKYYAKEVVDVLRRETSAQIFIYFGTCFGACDVPYHLERLEFDLCVQWGHSVFIKSRGMW